MSRDSLLTDLHAAVRQGDMEQARTLFEQLQLQHPNTAAEIVVRLLLSDEEAAAIGAT